MRKWPGRCQKRLLGVNPLSSTHQWKLLKLLVEIYEQKGSLSSAASSDQPHAFLCLFEETLLLHSHFLFQTSGSAHETETNSPKDRYLFSRSKQSFQLPKLKSGVCCCVCFSSGQVVVTREKTISARPWGHGRFHSHGSRPNISNFGVIGGLP